MPPGAVGGRHPPAPAPDEALDLSRWACRRGVRPGAVLGSPRLCQGVCGVCSSGGRPQARRTPPLTPAPAGGRPRGQRPWSVTCLHPPRPQQDSQARGRCSDGRETDEPGDGPLSSAGPEGKRPWGHAAGSSTRNGLSRSVSTGTDSPGLLALARLGGWSGHARPPVRPGPLTPLRFTLEACTCHWP